MNREPVKLSLDFWEKGRTHVLVVAGEKGINKI